ncbi:MAG: tripartite tricarboxylate transporter permease [Sphaerochaetaceae bacterium]|jgi:putative tricarboxylic transport membrane protein|nr:tripartite tricarboxylate transporter permease [Sphaerochaetaceae bacterium]
MMSLLGQGVLTVVGNPGILLAMFVGVFIGIIFGALPGLTTVACLSMFLPVTYVMSQEMGLSMLTAIYIGGMSGGLVSAILLNIPGTPSSIATCFDGTPMAKKGLAGKALGTGVFASIVGNFIGVLAMIFISPPLAAATLQFGPWENFGVTLFALTLIASLCGKNIYTGLLSAVFGMMFSTIGLDKIDSSQRFTFGFNSLTTGFGLLTVLVGMYAVSEVLKTASSDQQEGKVNEDFHMHGLGLTGTEIKSQSWNLLRSSLIGLAIGILPGIGGSTANIIAYSVAKSSSKYPEKFGTGIIDGICASESANNASVGGAMIPLLTLGIPGDGSTALLLGGFMLHGLQPGPLLFQNNGSIVYSIFASMLISTVMMGVIMYLCMRAFVKILKVPSFILIPCIIVLCSIGAYTLNYRTFDIWALLFFGIVGLGMATAKVPLPPFILGFILGSDFEVNLRTGLQYAASDHLMLLHRPIALTFVVLAVVFLVISIMKLRAQNKRELAMQKEGGGAV